MVRISPGSSNVDKPRNRWIFSYPFFFLQHRGLPGIPHRRRDARFSPGTKRNNPAAAPFRYRIWRIPAFRNVGNPSSAYLRHHTANSSILHPPFGRDDDNDQVLSECGYVWNAGDRVWAGKRTRVIRRLRLEIMVVSRELRL